MLLRYCSNCGTPNSVDPARIDKRTFCLACGEVLQVMPPQVAGAVLPSAPVPQVLSSPIEEPPLPPPVQVMSAPVAVVVPAPPVVVATPAPVVVAKATPTPTPAVVAPSKSRWEHPPAAPVPAPVSRAVVKTPATKAFVAAVAHAPTHASPSAMPQALAAVPFVPAPADEVKAEVVATPAPEVEPAPTTAEAEAVVTPAPRKWQLPRLHGSAGFFTSMIVHTIALVVLALVMINPPEKIPVMSFVASRPAHQAEEELLVEEFQVVEMEVEVDAIAEVSEVEALDSSAQVSLAEVSEDFGSGEGSPGQFTLPDGLLGRVPGSGGGGMVVGASSASFAKRLRRENAKTGDVQVSLLWNNFNDLDLHVRCPSGEVISFFHRNSRCRGELDVDMNAEGRVSNEPVENIYWPAGKAPFGTYFVVVHHYRNHGDPDPTQFEVEVKVDGKVRKMTGELRYGDPPLIVDRFERAKRNGVGGGSEEDDFYVE